MSFNRIESSTPETPLSEDEHKWIISQLRRAAGEAGPLSRVIKRIFLFGSVARGEATKASDTDIVVVLDGYSYKIDPNFYPVMRSALIRDGEESQLVPCSFHYVRLEVWDDVEGRTDIEEGYRHFVRNMKRDGIDLYES